MIKSYWEQRAELSDDAAALWEYMAQRDHWIIKSPEQLPSRQQRVIHELLEAGLLERSGPNGETFRLTDAALTMLMPLRQPAADLPVRNARPRE